MGTAKETLPFSILNKCHAILDFMNQYQQRIIPIHAVIVILMQAHDTHVDKYIFLNAVVGLRRRPTDSPRAGSSLTRCGQPLDSNRLRRGITISSTTDLSCPYQLLYHR